MELVTADTFTSIVEADEQADEQPLWVYMGTDNLMVSAMSL